MKGQSIRLFPFALGLVILILDTKTAIHAAAEGVELCIRQLIPSLFPFLAISGAFVSRIQDCDIHLLRPLERICRLAPGQGSLLLTGFLGGYPVGARSVVQWYRDGSIPREDAERMLGFCNNAGPSFLFGVTGLFFPNKGSLWLLWILHMISSVLTGILLPGSSAVTASSSKGRVVPFQESLEAALRTMAMICGWVLIFRVLTAYLERWLFLHLPEIARVFICGLLELSNGTLMLDRIQDSWLRFLAAGLIVTSGGLCVAMQTATICQGLSMKTYFLGKAVQSALFLLLAVHFMLPLHPVPVYFKFLLATTDILLLILMVSREKISSISAPAGV